MGPTVRGPRGDPLAFGPMPPRPPGRSWLPWVGLAGLLLAIAVAVAAALVIRGERDVSNPGVEFSETATQPPAREPPQQAPRRGHPADDGFRWPVFGYDDARTRVLGLSRPFRPPFRRAWVTSTYDLIEFPPVLCRRSVYLLADNGVLFKISRWTGATLWKRRLGMLAASSPACDGKGVFVVLLRRRGSGAGRVVALGAARGRMRWARRLPSRAESSPLLDRDRVIFGSEDGTVYALSKRTGRLAWRQRTAGAVKGAVAREGDRLFVGTYGGWVYALRRGSGRVLWRTRAAGGGAFGLGAGNFYSTPAVDYGRVYLGATNGAVYSLSARTGRLAWRKQTGAYVYASPAVGAVAGGPPTVWIGSYTGTFYALDARTGSVRWTRDLRGKISGSASVIGDLVFASVVDKRRTTALGANTGKVVWRWAHGAFTPAISDGRRLYLNGYSALFALDPKGFDFAKRPPPRRTPAARRAAKLKQSRAAAKQRARPKTPARSNKPARRARRRPPPPSCPTGLAARWSRTSHAAGGQPRTGRPAAAIAAWASPIVCLP